MSFAIVSVLAATLASDVIVGTADNFDGLIKEGVVLAEFYAPWCGHCKTLAPEWEKAATALKGKATLIKVDATEEKDLGTKYAVQGYPTIIAFLHGGDATPYDGGRVEDAIVSWATKMAGPAFNDVADKAAIDALLETNEAVVVGFYENEEAAAAFTKIASQKRGKFSFAVTYDAAFAKAEGATVPGVAVYKTFDNKKDIQTEYDEDKIVDFANTASTRAFGEIGPDNYQAYLDKGLPLGWVFVDPEADNEALKAVFSEIGAKEGIKGKVSLVHLSGPQYGQMAERVALSGKKWPAFGIDASGEHFTFDESKELTLENVLPWITAWAEGKIDKTVKSANAPEKATDENGVTTLVGTTFEELVNQKGKDVLIKFYAPWCGHCKQMIPDYEKLGKEFLDNDNVIIAKIDATENDSPGSFDVQGFPTLFLVNKENEVVKYENGRTFDEMSAFIKKLIE